MLLEEDEKARVNGLIINKFRGDKTILDPGVEMLEERGGVKVAGVVPYMHLSIEDEDSLSGQLDNHDLSLCLKEAHQKKSHVLRIPALKTTQIARIIHDLEQSLDSREYANELYHKLLFLELMVQLNRAALCNRIEYLSTTASNHKMINVIDYLNAHLTDDITIDFLAEHFYLSRYHLMHAFKEETGYTIGNYLTTKRLLLARDQIAQGESITTACYTCGFHNYSTFSRAYRKHFGCSPREQRN